VLGQAGIRIQEIHLELEHPAGLLAGTIVGPPFQQGQAGLVAGRGAALAVLEPQPMLLGVADQPSGLARGPGLVDPGHSEGLPEARGQPGPVPVAGLGHGVPGERFFTHPA